MQDLVLLFVLYGSDLKMRRAYLWVCGVVYILRGLQGLNFGPSLIEIPLNLMPAFDEFKLLFGW